MNFNQVNNIYFIGIGGIGISAIARMFLAQGKIVSGSDMSESEVTEGLRKAGATIFIGESAKNIPLDCDLVIYTIAISEKHLELVEAKRRGIQVFSYPEALGIFSGEKYAIVVTGTHGKTTTTAMVAKILIDAGLDPTVIVGSFLKSAESVDIRCLQTCRHLMSTGNTNGTNFVGGKSKYFVVEGCEYRRSFLNLSPKVLVITNIDNDHLDYYKDLDDIERAFSELSAKVPKDGAIVCDFADKRAKRAVSAVKGRIIDFGKYVKSVPKLFVPGVHNRKNAAVALAVAEFLGVDLDVAKKSLSEFKGTWRRFEFRGRLKNGVLVYDDYGHHPHEIEATLQGARELFPDKKIVVVFQPHLYSRTKQHLEDFGKCFEKADFVILLPIYSAREVDSGDISSEMVVKEIKKNGKSARFTATFEESADLALTLCGPDGLILTLGAGETNKVADILVSK